MKIPKLRSRRSNFNRIRSNPSSRRSSASLSRRGSTGSQARLDELSKNMSRPGPSLTQRMKATAGQVGKRTKTAVKTRATALTRGKPIAGSKKKKAEDELFLMQPSGSSSAASSRQSSMPSTATSSRRSSSASGSTPSSRRSSTTIKASQVNRASAARAARKKSAPEPWALQRSESLPAISKTRTAPTKRRANSMSALNAPGPYRQPQFDGWIRGLTPLQRRTSGSSGSLRAASISRRLPSVPTKNPTSKPPPIKTRNLSNASSQLPTYRTVDPNPVSFQSGRQVNKATPRSRRSSVSSQKTGPQADAKRSGKTPADMPPPPKPKKGKSGKYAGVAGTAAFGGQALAGFIPDGSTGGGGSGAINANFQPVINVEASAGGGSGSTGGGSYAVVEEPPSYWETNPPNRNGGIN